jgi:ribonuclease HI
MNREKRESDVTVRADGEKHAVAYVDGSYDVKSGAYSCGIVFIYNGEVTTFCKRYDDPDSARSRNVAGEIKGAELVMKHCAKHGIKRLDLFYDYEGIAAWCLGTWKANLPLTKAYRQFYDNVKKHLDVTFHKVTAHTGDKYNEQADRLARGALNP